MVVIITRLWMNLCCKSVYLRKSQIKINPCERKLVNSNHHWQCHADAFINNTFIWYICICFYFSGYSLRRLNRRCCNQLVWTQYSASELHTTWCLQPWLSFKLILVRKSVEEKDCSILFVLHVKCTDVCLQCT